MKTAKQLIAQLGINEEHAVSLLNRRARYAMLRDRVKVYASTPLGSVPVFGRRANGRAMTRADVSTDLLTLKLASDILCPMPNRTRDYVAAWCRLNHLMEC
jgi:hypothetical protein